LECRPPRQGRSRNIMATKRTGLGRGLEALLGQAAAPAATPAGTAPASESAPGAEPPAPRSLPVDLMVRGAYQPRQDMHHESLEDLANSIRAQGVIQPIVVRPLPEWGPDGS